MTHPEDFFPAHAALCVRKTQKPNATVAFVETLREGTPNSDVSSSILCKRAVEGEKNENYSVKI